jgi:hypothetical protein
VGFPQYEHAHGVWVATAQCYDCHILTFCNWAVVSGSVGPLPSVGKLARVVVRVQGARPSPVLYTFLSRPNIGSGPGSVIVAHLVSLRSVSAAIPERTSSDNRHVHLSDGSTFTRSPPFTVHVIHPRRIQMQDHVR